MLYECVECMHPISSDAWRCPNCGCKDAGSVAESAYEDRQQRLWEAERDRTDPGWRERESENIAAAKEKIAAAKEKSLAKEKKAVFVIIALLLYWSYLFPLLILKTQAMYKPNPFFHGDNVSMFLPVVNWFYVAGTAIFGVPFSPHVGSEFYGYILGWGLVGGILSYWNCRDNV